MKIFGIRARDEQVRLPVFKCPSCGVYVEGKENYKEHGLKCPGCQAEFMPVEVKEPVQPRGEAMSLGASLLVIGLALMVFGFGLLKVGLGIVPIIVGGLLAAVGAVLWR